MSWRATSEMTAPQIGVRVHWVVRDLRSVLNWLPLVVILAYIVVWPLVNFESQGLVGWPAQYREAYALPGIRSMLQTTVTLALLATLLAVIMGTLLAWCALRLPPRLEAAGSILPLMPLLVPAVALINGWLFLLSPRVGYLNAFLRQFWPFTGTQEGPFDIYTFGSIVFVSALSFSAFIYLFVYNGLRNTGQEYEEVASVCGASPLRTILTVTIPQLRPSLAYGAGIVFLLALGQFAAPLMLGGPAQVYVLSTTLFGLLQDYPIPFGSAAALGAPLLLVGAIVLILQRLVIGDVRRYATGGGRVHRSPRRPAWWAMVVIAVYALLAVLLPILALTYVALSPYWRPEVDLRTLTPRHITQVLFENRYLITAITTSVQASVATIFLVLPIGYLAARILSKRVAVPGAVNRLLDLLLLLPYSIPATLFGFALLFAYTRPPFVLYGTPAIMIVAYCTIMIPYSARLQAATLLSTDEDMWQASRVCGADAVRTFLSITVPLIRRGAAAAAAIIFVLLFHEFGVSLMVRSAGVQVIGSVLYDQYAFASYSNVAVLSLLMVVMTVVGVGFALSLGGSDSLKRTGK